MFWDNTVNKTFRVKEAIQPLQNSMLDNIRKEIKRFDADLTKFVKEFKSNGPFHWLDSRQKDAYTLLDKYQKQLIILTEKGKAVNELEDLFELSLSAHEPLHQVGEDLLVLKGLWDVILLVDSNLSSWKNTAWADIKTDDLLDEVKGLTNLLKAQPKKPRSWPLFKTLESCKFLV